MGRCLIVVTRMDAGSQNDEWVVHWNQDCKAVDDCFLLSAGGSRVVVLHGREGQFSADDQGAAEEIVQKTLAKLPSLAALDVGVIFHSPSGRRGFLAHALRQQLHNREATQVAFVKHYSSEEGDLYGKVTDLAKAWTRSGDASDARDGAFENVWQHLEGDYDLEARLEILHLCLSKEGAQRALRLDFSHRTDQEKLKRAFEPISIQRLSEMNPSSEQGSAHASLDRETTDVLRFLAGQESGDVWSDEYVATLGLLRDALLSKYS